MISTEINILNYIQLSEQDIDIITLSAKNDAIVKLQNILEDINESELNYSFELICKTTINKK